MTGGRRRAAILAVGCVLAWSACRRAPRQVEIDMARLEAATDEHADQALATARVQACFDGLIGRIGDLDLLPGLGKLKQRMEDDPALSLSVEAFLASLAKSDIFQQKVAEIARAHPDDSDDELAARLEKMADSAIDAPAFDKALDHGLDRLFEHPELVRRFRLFGDTLDAALEAALHSPSLAQTLAKRLTTWNGGEIPGRERATDLLIERVVTVERLTQLYAAILDLPAVEHQSSRAVASLSEKKIFGDILLKRLRALADDAELRRRAGVIFEVLLATPGDAAALEEAVVRALETPVVAAELAGLIDDVLASPELTAVGSEALTNITADPEFQRIVFAFLLGDPIPGANRPPSH